MSMLIERETSAGSEEAHRATGDPAGPRCGGGPGSRSEPSKRSVDALPRSTSCG